VCWRESACTYIKLYYIVTRVNSLSLGLTTTTIYNTQLQARLSSGYNTADTGGVRGNERRISWRDSKLRLRNVTDKLGHADTTYYTPSTVRYMVAAYRRTNADIQQELEAAESRLPARRRRPRLRNYDVIARKENQTSTGSQRTGCRAVHSSNLPESSESDDRRVFLKLKRTQYK